MVDWLKSRLRTRTGVAAATGLAVVILLALFSTGPDSIDSTGDPNATFTVRKGPLTISIRESGSIKARDQIVLKSEVEGQTQIISLVPEGTQVKQGDLLVELDASALNDGRIDQSIRVQNAEAAFINARENLEVVKSKAASDVKAAELAFQFAKEDLTKYVEGDYPMEVKKAQADIAVAQSEMSRSQEQLAGSKRLFEQGYLTAIEYERDKQNAEKAVLDLELARSALQLLQEYTYTRRMTELNSGIEEAESALERAKLTAAADVVQADAQFKANQSEFDRETDKLAKLDLQIERTKIFAPANGLVVHATTGGGGWRGSQEPLEEGQMVRERQELIYLPTATNMMAEVNVHESNLAKIAPGLGVRITADAVPGQTYVGHITSIAPMPDAQSSFMNPDLKVYMTKVTIDGDASALRTGMNCQAEIMIDRLEDAVHVPVQCIYSVGGKPTAFVVGSLGGVELRQVEIGHDNNEMVHIVSGLEPGEEVLLAPPLDMATKVDQAGAADGEEFVDADTSPAPQPEQPVQTTEAPQSEQFQPREGGDWSNMSEEERNERRQRFMTMSEEERNALMQERMKDMTPEQRAAMEERMKQFTESQGGERRLAE